MALESKKMIVPLEIITNGDATQDFLIVKNPAGVQLFKVKGDGTVVNGVPQAAVTAATVATSGFTVTAPGGADYLIQALVQNTGFGFVTANEGQSFLALVKNMYTRLEEMQARLVAAGIISA
jgi:hypothetical protein